MAAASFDLGPSAARRRRARATPHVVRSWPGVDLRLPPRGGGALLRAGGRRWTADCADGALGHRVRRRARTTTSRGRLFDDGRSRAAVAALVARRPRARPRAGGRRRARRACADRAPARIATRRRSRPRTCAVWNGRYADGDGARAREHPDDLDVAALYADALMNLTPWQLWDVDSGEPAAGARTLEAKAVLDAALARPGAMRHPGLLHLYIHLMEMSAHPEAALPAADALRDLVPDAGHLQHMPTHIDVLCGDYPRVISDNEQGDRRRRPLPRARRAAELLLALPRPRPPLPDLRRDVRWAERVALEAAARWRRRSRRSCCASRPRRWPTGWRGSCRCAARAHPLRPLGGADRAGAARRPGAVRVTTAMIHYGKGVALAATGRVDEAEAERERFRAAVAAVPETRYLFNNTCVDILADRRGDARRRDRLPRGRLRHRVRGAAARDRARRQRCPTTSRGAGCSRPATPTARCCSSRARSSEAEAVYRADLGLDDTLAARCQHPDNVWSLHGYHECLVAARQGRGGADRQAAARLALARADVPIQASCFCRLEA